MDELPAHKCWSCQREFDDGEGVSLNDTVEEHVCQQCWDRIPVDKRLWLGLAFRSFDQGGWGIGSLVRKVYERTEKYWPFGGGRN